MLKTCYGHCATHTQTTRGSRTGDSGKLSGALRALGLPVRGTLYLEAPRRASAPLGPALGMWKDGK